MLFDILESGLAHLLNGSRSVTLSSGFCIGGGGSIVAHVQVGAGAETVSHLLVNVLFVTALETLQLLNSVVQVLHDNLINLGNGSAGVMSGIRSLLGANGHAKIVLVVRVIELEVAGEQHVSIGAESLGLAHHGKNLGIFHILAEAGQEIVHGSNNAVRSTVTDNRVTVVGVTGRVLTAHGEPVVVVVGCGGVGTLKVVAEEHHEHAKVVRSIIAVVVRHTQRVEKTVERCSGTGRNSGIGGLKLTLEHGAALRDNLIELGAGSTQHESHE